MEILADPLICPLDPERISQVLVNLLANARKYSPPGKPVKVRLERGGEQARIAVSDRGLGIARTNWPGSLSAFTACRG